VLVAVLTTLALVIVPGTASAAAPTVTPLLDCVVKNADGSTTVVLGYTSTYPNQISIPLTNGKNYAEPVSYSYELPTRFDEGTHHGAFSMRVSATDLAGGVSWYLDGTTLDLPAAGGSDVCDSQQLPALANGAAVVLGVCLAGLAGLVMARRSRRRWAPASRAVQPAHEGQHDA
jgi:hypothetical protein